MESRASPWVKLNVCGKRMVVSRDTLCCAADSMLATMFSPNATLAPSQLDDDGAYLLDRDPHLFRAVLQWLRTGLVPHVERRALLREAQFFQLSALEALLCDPEPDFDRGSFVRAICAGPLRERALVGVRLSSLDLRFLHLSSLDFQHATLSAANLQHTSLTQCGFVKCTARRACFADIEGEKANFFGADLSDATFARANLTACVFSHACMTRCDFSGAKLPHAILQRANLSDACFRDAALADAHLQDANCQGCDFTGALGLDSAHMADCDLRGARLDWTKLGSHPWFRGAKVSQDQYDAIPLTDEQKTALKLRIVSDVETSDVRAVREKVAQHDFVVYVLGYGAVEEHGEAYSRETVRLLQSLADRYSVDVIDVVGQPTLIDTLAGSICQFKRLWPKVFFRGEFIGGYAETRARFAAE